jgi:hypothetical protein
VLRVYENKQSNNSLKAFFEWKAAVNDNNFQEESKMPSPERVSE